MGQVDEVNHWSLKYVICNKFTNLKTNTNQTCIYALSIGVNMDGGNAGRSIFVFADVDWRAYANKNRRIFAPNGAMWSFHNQISINFLVARCRKHCWSASRAFSHSFCPHNFFVALKSVAILREFFFRNKAKNADVFEKMRESGKRGEKLYFPHDCGMADTYECRSTW